MKIKSFFSSWVYPIEVLLSEQFSYGHREILLASHDLDPSLIFNASIQHGWLLSRLGTPLIRKRNFGIFPTLVWSERIAREMWDNQKTRTFILGSPFAHLAQALGYNNRNTNNLNINPNSILYFPSHSDRGYTAFLNPEFFDILNTYNFGRKTVSLFWSDFVNPRNIEMLNSYSFDVICHGYRGGSGFEFPWADTGGRTKFLFRLLDSILNHDVIAMSDVSTIFWYALALGKSVLITEGFESGSGWNGLQLTHGTESIYKAAQEVTDLSKIYINEIIKPSTELVRLARAEIGWTEAEDSMQSLKIRQLMVRSKIDKSLVLNLNSMILDRRVE